MVRLFEDNSIESTRRSSKGNQLKWRSDNWWYKADYTGYEGLTEYVVSNMLKLTGLSDDEYIVYTTEEIQYKNTKYLGCKSENFLPENWQLITLERLFQSQYGQSLNAGIYAISDISERIKFMVDQTVRMTGLSDFGKYVSKLLTIDAFFLNEDRHTHNIAVLVDDKNQYHYCPIFDNGASLLADTTMDYPLDKDPITLMDQVKSKTFCRDFFDQLAAVELLYGQSLHFSFDRKYVEKILDAEPFYDQNIKHRVLDVLTEQIRRYRYLFYKG